MKTIKNIVKIIITFSLLLFIFSSANAEQRYFWTDENGQTHVSETEPENWGAQEYEETKESKQAEIQRGRKEAIREDQIEAAEERKRSLPKRKRKKG
jgi:hypothetical protein